MTSAHRVKLLQALSPSHLWAFALAWWLLPLAWHLLKRHALTNLLIRLQLRQRQARPSIVPANTLHTWGLAVNRAGRLSPWPNTCLSRSLLLSWLLSGRGVAHQLRIGVRKQNGELFAHAWVDALGVPINDRATIAEDFAVFDGVVPASLFDTK